MLIVACQNAALVDPILIERFSFPSGVSFLFLLARSRVLNPREEFFTAISTDWVETISESLVTAGGRRGRFGIYLSKVDTKEFPDRCLRPTGCPQRKEHPHARTNEHGEARLGDAHPRQRLRSATDGLRPFCSYPKSRATNE
ncbi:hypothetical protein LENED_009535 [Lentinula edodes]|uniref:Uncharacterized protein n=1 Tax=Lentinula edodes TaxID=5353 RepID=A0A1Q3EK31_LENED|nr:hypothetical protein LENED_009535 [Lentinula edodes]